LECPDRGCEGKKKERLEDLESWGKEKKRRGVSHSIHTGREKRGNDSFCKKRTLRRDVWKGGRKGFTSGSYCDHAEEGREKRIPRYDNRISRQSI